eukprot:3727418-Rhodomonas_salina.1
MRSFWSSPEADANSGRSRERSACKAMCCVSTGWDARSASNRPSPKDFFQVEKFGDRWLTNLAEDKDKSSHG